MKFVVCECGEKIRVVQDLRQVKFDIDEHADTHGRTRVGRKEAEAERCRIETQLANKVIMAIIGIDVAESEVPALAHYREKALNSSEEA